MDGRPLRIIQWATGNIGLRALRAVIEHPAMQLVGLHSRAPEKLGTDAGTLCGLSETGIRATSSVAELVATPADCVLYMRERTDVDELAALLSSGKNIVTTRGDFHHPRSMDLALRSRIEAACLAGQASIHSTGSSPGFATEALVAPLLSLQRRLDCLTIDEYADLSSRNSPDLLFRVMGYGQPIGPYDQRRAQHVKADFAASLAQIADAVGLPCDDFDAVGEYAAPAGRIGIAAGVIEPGQVAAQRVTITGRRAGQPRFRFRANWYCTRALSPAASDWDLRPSGWRIRVEGDTPLDVGIGFPVAPEKYAAFTPGLTAHRAVNAVHAICAARPGIRTTVELPPILPLFG